MSLEERVIEAGVAATNSHDTYEDDDGWIVCKCGVPLPDAETWGDHYAGSVFGAVLAVLPEEPS